MKKEILVKKLAKSKRKYKNIVATLGIANNTIKEQIDEIHSLNVINEMNERHLKIAESEIKRLNVILNHTEMKYDEKVRNEND